MLQYALKFNKLNFNNHHEMNKLIGFCMMMKKEAINKIGLLDENFLIGNFEDDDYCIRLRKAGYKLILCNDTFIHHFGSVSFKNTPGLDIFEISKINEEKFKNKWNL
jgi:GT2 family glycosyltransferase